MKELIPRNNLGVFVNAKEETLVSSMDVAKFFNKRHDNVVRDIQNLECSKEFSLLNFEQSNYIDDRGKKQPCFYMTFKGFIFLTMGYRGKKAAAIKEAYITSFEDMQKRLSHVVTTREESPMLNENIKRLHEKPMFYHYSNEYNMINQLVLGKQAKQFRQEHGIPDGESIRSFLSTEQIRDIEILQNADIVLTATMPDYQARKTILQGYIDHKPAEQLRLPVEA